MKLYLHELECGSIKKSYKITTTEIEAIEKQKTYHIESAATWRRTIKKEEISTLVGMQLNEMFTLTPDTKPFIDALLQRTECSINNLKQRLSNCEEKKMFLLAQKKALAEGGEE